jgi:hypothetical protein
MEAPRTATKICAARAGPAGVAEHGQRRRAVVDEQLLASMVHLGSMLRFRHFTQRR